MTSFTPLNMASQGLVVQQQAASLHQQNIANAGAEGAHRVDLRVSSGALGIAPKTTVVRAEDVYGQRALNDQRAELGFARQQADLMRVGLGEQLGGVWGPADLPGSLGDFFAAWRDLERQPTNPSLRENVLDASEELAARVRATRQQLTEQADQVDQMVRNRVAQANDTLAEVAQLGGQILGLRADSPGRAALTDRRDAALGQLCESLGATTVEDTDGLTQAVLGGMFLGHSGHAHPLGTTVDPATGYAHVVVAGYGDLSLDSRISRGELGAELEVRDGLLAGIVGRLDTFARDLATAANTQHAAGFGLDGVGARNLFTTPPALPAGYGATIALDAQLAGQPDRVAAAGLAANLPSAADNAQAMGNLDGQLVALANTATLDGSLRQVAFDVGRQLGRAEADARAAAEEQEALQNGLEQRVGISLEEELARAVQAQIAYGASRKMLQILETLFPVPLTPA